MINFGYRVGFNFVYNVGFIFVYSEGFILVRYIQNKPYLITKINPTL
jgi:hypothetical protein